MRSDIAITAELRETRGKNEARRLRARGFMPAVVYGTGGDPVAIAVNPKELNSILRSRSGHNTIFDIAFDGQRAPVMVKDWQMDPIRGGLIHVDLQRIDMQKRMSVRVPVHTSGEPKGVKQQGGLFEIVSREIEIECLPEEIPQEFQMDVSEMLIGQNIRATDIPLTGSMKLVSSPDLVIVHVIAARGTATAEEAAAVAPATAEPEIIKKGKKEEAEEPAKKKK
jgi:large subunit ribosomal protein L25